MKIEGLPEEMKRRAELDETGRYLRGVEDGMKLAPSDDKKLRRIMLHIEGALVLLNQHLDIKEASTDEQR